MLRPASRRLTRILRILTRESRILGAQGVRPGRVWTREPARQRPLDERLFDSIQVLAEASNSTCTLDVFQSPTDDGGEYVDFLSYPCLRRPRAPPGPGLLPRSKEARRAGAQPRERPSRAFPRTCSLLLPRRWSEWGPPTAQSSEALILGRIT